MANLTRQFARKLEDTHWGKAVTAAFIAGVSFLFLQMLISGATGQGAWMPVRMIAAIALGTGVLPDSGADLWVLWTAFLIHFGLSLLTAWIMAPIIQDMAMGKALAVGAGFGVLIYVVNFYLLTELFTWFAGARGLATLLNHLVFGVVLAYSYESLRRRAAGGLPAH